MVPVKKHWNFQNGISVRTLWRCFLMSVRVFHARQPIPGTSLKIAIEYQVSPLIATTTWIFLSKQQSSRDINHWISIHPRIQLTMKRKINEELTLASFIPKVTRSYCYFHNNSIEHPTMNEEFSKLSPLHQTHL